MEHRQPYAADEADCGKIIEAIIDPEWCDGRTSRNALVKLQPHTEVIDAEWWELQVIPDAPAQSWCSPRRLGIVAGVTAIALTSGVVAQIAHQKPVYEGKFQLAVKPIAPTHAAIALPKIEDVNQSISQSVSQSISQLISKPTAEPTIETETQIQVLQSPRMNNSVLKQLQAQHIKLDSAALIRHLNITAGKNNTLEVRYRGTDPQQVQFVLRQLAQTYLDYSGKCQDSQCLGVNFVEAKLPQVQQHMSRLQVQLHQLQQQHGLTNPTLQLRLFSARSTELAKESAEINGQLADVHQKYSDLQAKMGLSSGQAIAPALLSQNATYRSLFQQLQKLDDQIAGELSQVKVNSPNLKNLYTQHHILQSKLYQVTQQVLKQYLSNPKVKQYPIFQDPVSLNLLQQSIDLAHSMQVLQIRQQALAQATQSVVQQRSQLVPLLRQYDDLQRQLQAETEISQEYLDRLESFQAQSSAQKATWQLISPPEVIKDHTMELSEFSANMPRNLGAIAGLGLLLGIGIASVLEQRTGRINSTGTIRSTGRINRINRSSVTHSVHADENFLRVRRLEASSSSLTRLPMDVVLSKVSQVALTEPEDVGRC